MQIIKQRRTYKSAEPILTKLISKCSYWHKELNIQLTGIRN